MQHLTATLDTHTTTTSDTLLRAKESVIVSETLLDALDLTVGQQFRVNPVVPNTETGDTAYTIVDTRDSDGEYVVWMTSKQRKALRRDAIPNTEVPSVSEVTVKPFAPHPMIESVQEASNRYEFIERSGNPPTQSNVVVMAPHGGMIEQQTAKQAKALASRLNAPFWTTHGFGGAFPRWHISSNDIHPESFPELQRIVTHDDYLYGFGFHGTSYNYIGIGGRIDRDVKLAVAAELRTRLDEADIDVEIRILSESDRLNGMHPENVVNRYAEHEGLHLEQPLQVRQRCPSLVVDAVEAVFQEFQP